MLADLHHERRSGKMPIEMRQMHTQSRGIWPIELVPHALEVGQRPRGEVVAVSRFDVDLVEGGKIGTFSE